MIKLNKQLRALLGSESEPKYPIENAPLFITGCMRSGTTLLVDKLSWHPQLLKIGTELNDIWTDYGNAPIREKCIAMNASNANYESLRQMTIYFTKFIQESKGIKRHIIRSADKLRTGKGRVFYDWENIIPVNKSPHLINKIDFLEKIFPESKFLVIIRNPYANAASSKSFFHDQFRRRGVKYFVPKNEQDCWHYSELPPKDSLVFPGNFESIPLMWRRLNLMAIAAMEKFPDKVLLISYEALLSNPDNEFDRIFDFLDLKEKHQLHEKRIIENKYKHYNTKLKGSPLNKWKKVLTNEEIRKVKIEEKKFINSLNNRHQINKLIDEVNIDASLPSIY